MIRRILVFLLILTAFACRKGKGADEIQEPIGINARDEIAFIAKKPSNVSFQLFLMQADGTGLRALSNDSISNEPIAVSHDGNKFLVSVYDNSRVGKLYVVDKRGGAPVLVASDSCAYGSVSWSPDDRSILFLKWIFGRTAGALADVCVMDSDGKNEKQLTTDGRNLRPRWFPDGNRIIFNHSGNNAGIYIMDANGNNTRRVGEVWAINADAVLSPAGDKIAMGFVTPEENKRSLLYVMNADGSGMKQIITAPPPSVSMAGGFNRNIELSPAWSPDGSKITYACRVDGNSEIFVVDSDGSNNLRLTRSNKWEATPSWSKDGQHIIYLANDATDFNNPKIYIMRANGHSPTLLSKDDGYVMYPLYIGK
jgi:Tol biopolymer transport system component